MNSNRSKIDKTLKRKILYIEACDFENYPLGGTLSFSKHFIKNIKDDFYLVGLGKQPNKIGKWETKQIDNRTFKFYSIGIISDVEKTILPKRIYTYFLLKKHINKIHKEKSDIINLVFTQTPQFVFLISKFKWNFFSFCFAGLGNSVGLSRFKLLRVFGGAYEKALFRQLKKTCNLILAAADEEEINKKSLKYNLEEKKIYSFPTRFDDKTFYLKENKGLRQDLGLPLNSKIIVTTGRLSYIKGWKDLIDSFRIAKSLNKKLRLIFVGDGEDKKKIINYAPKEISENEIVLLGRKTHEQIASILNEADLFVMLSFSEGWPTSMVEALACGKNIVSTRIGGATEMISQRINGIIVNERNSLKFSEAIIEALNYNNPNPRSLEIAKKFSASTLDIDFKNLLANV